MIGGRKLSLTLHGMFGILFNMRFHKCTILYKRKLFGTVTNADLLGKLPNIEKPHNGLVKVIGNVPWVFESKGHRYQGIVRYKNKSRDYSGNKSLRRVR